MYVCRQGGGGGSLNCVRLQLLFCHADLPELGMNEFYIITLTLSIKSENLSLVVELSICYFHGTLNSRAIFNNEMFWN